MFATHANTYCAQLTIVAVAIAAACRTGGATSALLDELSRDTTIVHTAAGLPSDSAIGRLLARLGVPLDAKLAVVDTGCALGRRTNEADTIPARQRVVCRMESDGPPIELELFADTKSRFLDSLRVFDLPRSADAPPLQTLIIDGDESVPRGGRYLFAVDLDGDATRELMIIASAGATGNREYQVWRYNAVTKRLAADSILSQAKTPMRLLGRPCLREWWNGGAAGLLHDDYVSCAVGDHREVFWSNSGGYDRDRALVIRQVVVWVGGTHHIVRNDTIPEAVWERSRPSR